MSGAAPPPPVGGAGPTLSVGVGIGTGPAFVGNIQSSDRFIWTVIGDTVNLAARLQSMTRELHAAVAIDDTTYRRAGRESQSSEASMGPRSIERGNEALDCECEDHDTASMGPRSIERGNWRPCRRREEIWTSFNGAALN